MKVRITSQDTARIGDPRKTRRPGGPTIEVGSFQIAEFNGGIKIEAEETTFNTPNFGTRRDGAGKETERRLVMEVSAKELKVLLERAIEYGLIEAGFRIGRKKKAKSN